jgi:hypothetical protein
LIAFSITDRPSSISLDVLASRWLVRISSQSLLSPESARRTRSVPEA